MLNDRHLKKLNEAWAAMNAPVAPAPTNEAVPTAPSQMPALLEEFKNLITMKDDEIEVEIDLGWHGLAALYEDNGKWFPLVMQKQISTFGYPTKEEAMKKLIAYFKDAD